MPHLGPHNTRVSRPAAAAEPGSRISRTRAGLFRAGVRVVAAGVMACARRRRGAVADSPARGLCFVGYGRDYGRRHRRS